MTHQLNTQNSPFQGWKHRFACTGILYLLSSIQDFPEWTPATKLGQGYIFTGVCDSVTRRGGVCLSACSDTTPWQGDPPHKETPPTPSQRDTPWQGEPPPPCAVHAGRYSQQAGGMHPTGMQFLFGIIFAENCLKMTKKLD